MFTLEEREILKKTWFIKIFFLIIRFKICRFQLYYYSDKVPKKDEILKETVLTICNNQTKTPKTLDPYNLDYEETEDPVLELAIKSK